MAAQVDDDKPTYNFNATPSSPTNSSSTITQSTSNCNSVSTASTSPSQPVTPPRSNPQRGRYPAELGRVPLHRRGTDQTYERLEDLLREAGYKETRVFTPETDRYDAEMSERTDVRADVRAGVRNSVGALVGYLAGFVPSAMASRTSLHVIQDTPDATEPQGTKGAHVYSPSLSPLAPRRPKRKETSSSSEPQTPASLTSSLKSLDPTPRPSRNNSVLSRPSTPMKSNTLYTQSPTSSTHDLHRSRHSQRLVAQCLPNNYDSDNNLPYAITSPSHRGAQAPSLSNTQPGIFVTPAPPTPPSTKPPSTQVSIMHPQPSRAGAYLRHMVSVPDMPKRPSSSPVHPSIHRLHSDHRPLLRPRKIVLNDSDTEGTIRDHCRRDEHVYPFNPEDPPLPRTWLETVARAVLVGGIGAYIGGPMTPTSSTPSGPVSAPPSRQSYPPAIQQQYWRTLRPTRSSLSQVSQRPKSYPHQKGGSLSDRTNTTGSRGSTSCGGVKAWLPPPDLFARIGRGRARMSVGEVNQTVVTCRSAPASRASSRTRNGSRAEGRRKGGGDKDDKDRKGRRKGKGQGDKGRGGKSQGTKDAEHVHVPTLSSTRIEGDAWHAPTRTRGKSSYSTRASSGKNKSWSGWGAEPHSREESADENESEDDEDGELDLARMLVNPKRQNSIWSLRKHLDMDGEVLASSNRGGQNQSQRIQEEVECYGSEAEAWGRGWVRAGMKRTGRSEDDDEERARRFGSGRSAGKKRTGLPGPWGFIGAS